MADVFISYRRCKIDPIRRQRCIGHLSSLFQIYGFSTWFDEELEAGAWRAQLEDQLRSARAVVALQCKTYHDENSFALAEFNFAIKLSKVVIPIEVEPMKIQIVPQGLQVFSLIEWDGDPLTFRKSGGHKILEIIQSNFPEYKKPDLDVPKALKELQADWNYGRPWYSRSSNLDGAAHGSSRELTRAVSSNSIPSAATSLLERKSAPQAIAARASTEPRAARPLNTARSKDVISEEHPSGLDEGPQKIEIPDVLYWHNTMGERLFTPGWGGGEADEQGKAREWFVDLAELPIMLVIPKGRVRCGSDADDRCAVRG